MYGLFIKARRVVWPKIAVAQRNHVKGNQGRYGHGDAECGRRILLRQVYPVTPGHVLQLREIGTLSPTRQHCLHARRALDRTKRPGPLATVRQRVEWWHVPATAAVSVGGTWRGVDLPCVPEHAVVAGVHVLRGGSSVAGKRCDYEKDVDRWPQSQPDRPHVRTTVSAQLHV